MNEEMIMGILIGFNLGLIVCLVVLKDFSTRVKSDIDRIFREFNNE